MIQIISERVLPKILPGDREKINQGIWVRNRLTWKIGAFAPISG
ncbi:hypothetical protein [Aestuariispira insulae]|nr:hypothetical protein [Aestuariispira insulae]